MDVLLLLKLLFLLTVANGTPVLATRLMGDRFATPIDLGARFVDGKPLLGGSKTWRGLIFSVLVTALAAWAIGYSFLLGAGFAAVSLGGDLLSSFTKRRLGLASSSMALGLDQIPEALLPLLAFYAVLDISLSGILLVVALFFAGELVVSRLLYAINIRDRPY